MLQLDVSDEALQEPGIKFSAWKFGGKKKSLLAGSERFLQFLSLLGDRVTLQHWRGYSGGLDVRANMTGEESFYTRIHEHEVMFHVSTLLPFYPDDKQQVDTSCLDCLVNNI